MDLVDIGMKLGVTLTCTKKSCYMELDKIVARSLISQVSIKKNCVKEIRITLL